MLLFFVLTLCYSSSSRQQHMATLDRFTPEQLKAMIVASAQMKQKPDYVKALESVHDIMDRMNKVQKMNFTQALHEIADAYEHAAKLVIDLSLDLSKSAEVAAYVKTIGGGLQLLGAAAAVFGKPGVAKLGKVAVAGGRGLTVASAIHDIAIAIIKDSEVRKRYGELLKVIEKYKGIREIYPELHQDFQRLEFIAIAIEEDKELSNLGLGEDMTDLQISKITFTYGVNVAHLAMEAKQLHNSLKAFGVFKSTLKCDHGLKAQSKWSGSLDKIFAAFDVASGVMGILQAHKEQAELKIKLKDAEEQKQYIQKQAKDIEKGINMLKEEYHDLDLTRIAKEYDVDKLPDNIAQLFLALK